MKWVKDHRVYLAALLAWGIFVFSVFFFIGHDGWHFPWADKPLSSATVGDIAGIVLIGALIARR